MTPEECTAAAAPVIDRVVIGIHLRSQEHVRGLARAHGLDRAGPLVEFRSALLAGPVARSTAEAVARYFPAGGLDEELEVQRAQGMLEIDAGDGRIRLTERGRVVVEELYDVHAEVTVEAWSDREPEVRSLNEMTDRLLEAGMATAGPAFAGMGRPHERVGDPVELLLFNRLAAFRYHRADAHAAAWAAAGHTAETVDALADGPERAAIEADTNRRAAPPYVTLSEDERTAYVAALSTLR